MEQQAEHIPKVSVVVPNFNKGKYVADTLDSLLKQTYTEWEAFLVDDHSTDDSLSILQEYVNKDARFQLIKPEKPFRNGSACRNFGLKKARGEWVLFLDSDDLLAPFCLENRMAQVERNSDSDWLVFPLATFVHKPGDSEHRWIPTQVNALNRFLAHDLPWQTMQPLWKRTFVEELKGFDDSFNRLQDVEFHTRALLRSDRFVAFSNKEPDCFFRIDEGRIVTQVDELSRNWTDSAIRYYHTFWDRVNPDQRKYLTLTLLETWANLWGRVIGSSLNRIEFNSLERNIFDAANTTKEQNILKLYAGIQRRSSGYVRGLKWIIKKIWLLRNN